jgi:hypothetical protein
LDTSAGSSGGLSRVINLKGKLKNNNASKTAKCITNIRPMIEWLLSSMILGGTHIQFIEEKICY